MTTRFFSRCHHGEPDAGVYAVLYAVLMVVLIAMGAIVVDFASVRQDRRLDRSATDSAVLGAGEFLNPQGTNGVQPYAACLRAWDYLSATLRITTPGTACAAFGAFRPSVTPHIDAAAYCASSPPEIDDNQTVGDRTVRVAWPIPHTGGSGFLNPDLAPGAVQQTFSTDFDGSDSGCDRIGAAIFESPTFLLGGVLGARGTNVQVHSVARFNIDGGPEAEVAALNVLNPNDCGALRVTGGGKAVVGPTTDAVGPSPAPSASPLPKPGIVAVESDGNGTCNGLTATTITRNGAGGTICAALSTLNAAATNCDGKGIIRSHALDPGGHNSYNTADTAAGALRPVPTPEGGLYGWSPVTNLYGCATICGASAPAPASNSIKKLTTAYGKLGDPIPAAPYPGMSPYPTSPASTFTDISPQVCAGITSSLNFSPGNYFINCDLNLSNAGVTLSFNGPTSTPPTVPGTSIVVNGGLHLTKGCLVVNAAASNCAPGTWVAPGTANVTAGPTPPTSDAILYLRGDDFQIANSSSLVMPQTFVYQAAAAKSLNITTTGPVLWTAPGAGAVDTSTGLTTLETMCSQSGTINQDCMNSRFARLAYWSEYPAPSTKPDNFTGQGALSLAGVFFAPRAYLNLSGGSGYTGASAQFWADMIDLNGTGTLVLSPDTRTAISTPTGAVSLIR